MIYPDRWAAGRTLGAALVHLRAYRPLVLGLPRGGVPVAAAVRDVVRGELDVLLVRKLGVPGQPELAMGAIGEDGVQVLNDDVVRRTGVRTDQIEAVAAVERAELSRRRQLVRARKPRVSLRGRTVVIVDDGMATGATVAVACRVARAHDPQTITVAVPVSSPEAMDRLRGMVHELVCPVVPRALGGVGAAYRDFHQLDDREMLSVLCADAPPGPSDH